MGLFDNIKNKEGNSVQDTINSTLKQKTLEALQNVRQEVVIKTFGSANEDLTESDKTQTFSVDSPTPNHPVVKKFKKLYKEYKGTGNRPEGINILPGGKCGFGGSGKSNYEFQGHKFSVDRSANGKTFWGTHHHITHHGEMPKTEPIKEEVQLDEVLIHGKHLNDQQKQHVKNAFVHRFTGEHTPKWSEKPMPNGNAYKPTHKTDDEWIKDHAFHFDKKTGRLSANHKYAEPGYMAESRDPFGFGKKDLARLNAIDQSIKSEVAAAHPEYAANKPKSQFQKDLEDWRNHDRGAIPKGKLNAKQVKGSKELTAGSLWKGLGGKTKTGKKPVTGKDLLNMSEDEKSSGHELFYGSGGHGGPYPSHEAAAKRAAQMLKGSKSETQIHIKPRTATGVGGYGEPVGRVYKDSSRGGKIVHHHIKNGTWTDMNESVTEDENTQNIRYKVGDKVKPKVGPHAGHPHEIIHIHDNGNMNIRPIGLSAKQTKYRLGAVQAKPEHLEQMNEAEVNEVSPPGWSGTTKAMKKHKSEIDNPFALAWYMKNKGDKPHYKPEKKS